MSSCIDNKTSIQSLKISQTDKRQEIDVTQKNIKQNLITNQVTEINVQGGYSPYIGSNGNWWQYDDATKQFVDTKVYAGGNFDYDTAFNKPKLNHAVLQGSKDGSAYGLINSEDYITNEEIYSIVNN